MKNYNKLLLQLFPIVMFLFTIDMQAQTLGCRDSLATNFNPFATINDGSCLYDTASVSPVNSWSLSQTLNETSGLIIWNNKFWTHNDDTDRKVYALDTLDINNYSEYPLALSVNNDWEEISQDDDFIYIGDFGNNSKNDYSVSFEHAVHSYNMIKNSRLVELDNEWGHLFWIGKDYAQSIKKTIEFIYE